MALSLYSGEWEGRQIINNKIDKCCKEKQYRVRRQRMVGVYNLFYIVLTVKVSLLGDI